MGWLQVGPHPSGMALAPNGNRLYVACTASDEVAVIDTKANRVVETGCRFRSDARLPFGSGPNALAVSPDGARLYVANGTDNAIAVVDLGTIPAPKPAVTIGAALMGFIPTAW